jgi:hypothetical protein
MKRVLVPLGLTGLAVISFGLGATLGPRIAVSTPRPAVRAASTPAPQAWVCQGWQPRQDAPDNYACGWVMVAPTPTPTRVPLPRCAPDEPWLRGSTVCVP